MMYEDPSRNTLTQTRRENVLQALLRHPRAWIPGPDLAAAHVGGSEALRRLRELRAQGWRIEGRRMVNRDAWEYRILTGRTPAAPAAPTPGLENLELPL